jgi:hypothetical protein
MSSDDVKPSMDGYQVLGSFNPGAVNFGDEILLFATHLRAM